MKEEQTIQLSFFNTIHLSGEELKEAVNVLVPQNNRESEEILLMCEKRLSNNCRIILEAFQRGERLTGIDIMSKYNITEYRARIRDLKAAGFEIKYEIGKSGCKTWWIEK